MVLFITINVTGTLVIKDELDYQCNSNSNAWGPMLIVSEDKKSYINIDFEEDELEHLPSVRVSVSIRNAEFSGCNNRVWLELDIFKAFISELEVIDMNRKGSAALGSMSPDDFSLKIETYGLTGHLTLRYKLSKSMYCPEHTCLSITGGFELDTSNFSNLVKEFKRFLQKYFY